MIARLLLNAAGRLGSGLGRFFRPLISKTALSLSGKARNIGISGLGYNKVNDILQNVGNKFSDTAGDFVKSKISSFSNEAEDYLTKKFRIFKGSTFGKTLRELTEDEVEPETQKDDDDNEIKDIQDEREESTEVSSLSTDRKENIGDNTIKRRIGKTGRILRGGRPTF